MGNPFEIIDSRLSNIEGLLLSIKHSDAFKKVVVEDIDRCNFNDALKITGLSKSKLYKLTSTGSIPCKQYGNRLVFSKKELLAWMESETKPKHDIAGLKKALAQSAKRKGGAF